MMFNFALLLLFVTPSFTQYVGHIEDYLYDDEFSINGPRNFGGFIGKGAHFVEDQAGNLKKNDKLKNNKWGKYVVQGAEVAGDIAQAVENAVGYKHDKELPSRIDPTVNLKPVGAIDPTSGLGGEEVTYETLPKGSSGANIRNTKVKKTTMQKRLPSDSKKETKLMDATPAEKIDEDVSNIDPSLDSTPAESTNEGVSDIDPPLADDTQDESAEIDQEQARRRIYQLGDICTITEGHREDFPLVQKMKYRRFFDGIGDFIHSSAVAADDWAQSGREILGYHDHYDHHPRSQNTKGGANYVIVSHNEAPLNPRWVPVTSRRAAASDDHNRRYLRTPFDPIGFGGAALNAVSEGSHVVENWFPGHYSHYDEPVNNYQKREMVYMHDD